MAELFGHSFQDGHALGHDLGTDAVTRQQTNGLFHLDILMQRRSTALVCKNCPCSPKKPRKACLPQPPLLSGLQGTLSPNHRETGTQGTITVLPCPVIDRNKRFRKERGSLRGRGIPFGKGAPLPLSQQLSA